MEPPLKYLGTIVVLGLKCMAIALILELAYRLCFPLFRYSVREACLIAVALISVSILWAIWGKFDLPSRVRVTRAAPWSSLLPIIKRSFLYALVPGFFIALYGASLILDLRGQNGVLGDVARFVNEKVVHFNILGLKFDGQEVFRLEVLGFVIGFVVWGTVFWLTPIAFRQMHDQPNWKDLLVRTIREDGRSIPIQHLYLTLEHTVDNWADLPEHSTYIWSAARSRLARLHSLIRTEDVGCYNEAALVADALPPDNPRLRELTESLFDYTKPVQRLVAALVFFAVASSLILLPILLRLLALIPALEGT